LNAPSNACCSRAAGCSRRVYLGLSLALLALGVKFFQEAFHV
jgi:hypothetical protein